MKTQCASARAVAVLVLLLGAGTARAGDFIVVTDELGTNATGILNLEVDGVLYDVEFVFDFGLDVFGAPPFTFQLEIQAINAHEAVNIALNSEPLVTTVGPDWSKGYAVPFDFDELSYVIHGSQYSPVLADWAQVPNSHTVDQLMPFSYAVFTVVPTPATACLLVPALAMLGGRRRKRTT